MIGAGKRLICGHHEHIQAVDLFEFSRFCLRSPCHAREFVVHAEIILEGDRGERLVFPLYLYAFFRLKRLVQAVRIAPSGHKTAGKLIYYDNLTILDHVAHVLIKEIVSPYHLPYVRLPLGLHIVVQVLDPQKLLALYHALFSKVDGMVLLVNYVVNALFDVQPLMLGLDLVFIGYLLPIQLGIDLVYYIIFVRRFFGGAGDNKRGPGLIHQYAIDLIHDSVVSPALHHVLLPDHHIIPQVIKAELVVCSIGDVTGVRLFPLFRGHVVFNVAAA